MGAIGDPEAACLRHASIEDRVIESSHAILRRIENPGPKCLAGELPGLLHNSAEFFRLQLTVDKLRALP